MHCMTQIFNHSITKFVRAQTVLVEVFVDDPISFRNISKMPLLTNTGNSQCRESQTGTMSPRGHRDHGLARRKAPEDNISKQINKKLKNGD